MPGWYSCEPSPSGGCFYVLERVMIRGQEILAHRDTCKSMGAARTMASELRRGLRTYNPDKGHTEPVRRDT